MIYDFFMKMIGKIHWEGLHRRFYGRRYMLNTEDWLEIKDVLSKGYFIILTRRKTHLSTFACALAHFFLTGRWGYYSHALVNVDEDRATYGFNDFKFMEAIGSGVQFSKWHEVFSCDSVCILKPRWYTIDELNASIGVGMEDIGKSYDDRFKVYDDMEMSCVEVARKRMSSLPLYSEKMRVFEYMIQNEKNLTPEMFRECPDFEVLLEIRK